VWGSHKIENFSGRSSLLPATLQKLHEIVVYFGLFNEFFDLVVCESTENSLFVNLTDPANPRQDQGMVTICKGSEDVV